MAVVVVVVSLAAGKDDQPDQGACHSYSLMTTVVSHKRTPPAGHYLSNTYCFLSSPHPSITSVIGGGCWAGWRDQSPLFGVVLGLSVHLAGLTRNAAENGMENGGDLLGISYAECDVVRVKRT